MDIYVDVGVSEGAFDGEQVNTRIDPLAVKEKIKIAPTKVSHSVRKLLG
jgi:hypothetical protein